MEGYVKYAQKHRTNIVIMNELMRENYFYFKIY